MPPVPNTDPDSKHEYPYLCEYCNDGMETRHYKQCDCCRDEFCGSCMDDGWAYASHEGQYWEVCGDCVSRMIREAMKLPVEQRTILYKPPKQ